MGALQGVSASRLDGVAQLFELDRQQRQLLADVVVQFARDARPLGFLRGDQTAGEIADPGVAVAKFCLALEDALFGLTALPSMHEQTGDEQRLDQQHRDRADDVELVALPGGRLTKLDTGSGRDASLADVPATELPPVDLVDIGIDLGCRDTVGAFAAEHAQRLLGGELDGTLEADQAAAYEPMVQPQFHERVERRIRGRGHAIERLDWRVVPTCAVPRDEQVVDERSRRQRPQSLFEVGHRQPRQVSEGEFVPERL